MSTMPGNEPRVRLVPRYDQQYWLAPPPASKGSLAGSRFAARLVILLFVACISLALYDLVLLLNGLR